MKRLALLLLLSAPEPTWEAGNAFAMQYKRWADLRNVRVQSPGTISAPELIAWQKLKSAFRQLEKAQEAEYRGGR